MIRQAEVRDIEQMIVKGRKFFDESGYAKYTTYDEEAAERTFRYLIECETCLIDDECRGGIGYVIFPAFMSDSMIIAQEVFWWVDEEQRGSSLGVKLLKAAEEDARLKGADVCNIITLNDLGGQQVGKLLNRMGYVPTEQYHSRKL